jgi:4-hydroxy-tetrahydrodipicolinate synthase
MDQLNGTGVALVTPFTDEGRIDERALEHLVEHQINGGVDYLVVLGTTGETATLDAEEKQLVKDLVRKANKGRLPLVIGVGGNDTRSVSNELRHGDLAGFDAVLSVSPYYNKPSQKGIYAHFAEVAKSSPLPVILYNVPPRTGSNVLPDTVLALARDFENIVAVKEASGNFEQAMDIIKNKPDGFSVISGEDKLALPLVLAGGSGVISVIGQALPESFSSLIRLGLEGKPKEAFDLFYPLMESIDLIFAEGNPTGVKYMLKSLGITGDKVRLPLVGASAELQKKIDNFVLLHKS